MFFLQEQNWWHPSNSTFLQVYIFLKSNINSSKLGPTRTVRANNSSKSAKRSNNLTTLIRFEIFQFQLLQESHDDKQIVYCNNVKQLNRTSSRASRSRAFILDRAQHAPTTFWAALRMLYISLWQRSLFFLMHIVNPTVSVFAAECLLDMMSLRATINGYTAWANMRLVREFCEADNILIDIMQGPRMKVLLHC